MTDIGIQLYLTYGVIIGAIILYTIDRIPLEMSSLATVAVLLLIFHVFPLRDATGGLVLGPRELLAGFADPALITIMSLLVVGQGLVQTGALNGPAQRFVALGERAPTLTLVGSLLIVMIVSGVMNNTPVVVMFIPILAALADRLGQKSAMVMMPLSFVAILGGNLTLIGSSTNLLAVGAYTQAGGEMPSFFSFTIPGAAIAGAGLFYILFLMPRLLVDRSSMAGKLSRSQGKQFLFQIELDHDHKMIGEKAIAGIFPGLKDITIRMIQRGHEQLLPPFDDLTLQKGDIVSAAATRHAMTDLFNTSPSSVASAEGSEAGEDAGEQQASAERRLMAEAVVAPASRLDGRTIAQTGFRAETGCMVLGVQRRSRMLRASLGQLRLEAGDVLLLLGSRLNVLELKNNRDVILMESSATDVPLTVYAWRARMIFAAVVMLASTGVVPIAITALLGAVLMMVTRCLNVRQASRAIDRRVFTIVGAALAMGAALQATGGASVIAHGAIGLLTGAPVWLLLSCFFLLVALLTNVLSNNATAVLFTPIAVSLATGLGVDPFPFLLAVIFGANCSFATPMSYQTNLLVMAPGHYQFNDFLRAGTPLIFINWISFTLFVPWYYGLL